ncbi:putative tubulin polyglutamylase ttll-15 [Tubulanus polymorphus]|uniref:putative tubulin polyglutamylase ttll-15 n=1 Tax=Tubulanus polymorphus TaxID=672921 RepID=UPI003DA30640
MTQAPTHQSGVSSRFTYIVLGVLIFGLVLTILNVYELRRLQSDHFTNDFIRAHEYDEPKLSIPPKNQPVFTIVAARPDSGYLDHVLNLFQRSGYIRGSLKTRWDVLWSHEYPFADGGDLEKRLRNLAVHQKVNHFPGTGYVTNKNSLAVTKIHGIPKAFRLPHQADDFKKYAAKFPKKMWVQKSNTHRGIKIKSMKELDFTAESTFIQEYIDRPFLVDGRKFDIGVYTVLTSINPLRVYTMDAEVLLRFCPKDYHPFDASDIDKYVVGDDYTPTWQIPSLKHYYADLNFTHRESLNTYIRKLGKNDTQVWLDIKDTIRNVYLEKEPYLISSAAKYKSSRNFFEMVRFDFVLDENLNVYLMEANMSPNLSSLHFKPNRLLYEQVLHNLFSLVGIVRPLQRDIFRSSPDEAEMQVSDKDIHVFSDICSSPDCSDNCNLEKCQVCNTCLTSEQRQTLKYAYLEHLTRRNMGRVFPPVMSTEWAAKWTPANDRFYRRLRNYNKLIYRWFVGKCKQAHHWC